MEPPSPSLIITPAVGGVNARKDEGGGHRFAVGPVAEGDRLGGVVSEPVDQLADRFGLSVWPRPDRPASRARLLRWHREHGALLEHLRGRANRQHVPALGLIEAIAQPSVLAIGVIAEHRRPRNIPT